jgi:hypothetical protein
MPCLRVHGKSCTSLVLCLEKRRLFNNHCGKHMRHCNSAGRDMDGVVLCRRRSLVLLFLGWASVAGAFSRKSGRKQSRAYMNRQLTDKVVAWLPHLHSCHLHLFGECISRCVSWKVRRWLDGHLCCTFVSDSVLVSSTHPWLCRLLVGKPEFSADGTILGLAWGSVCADDSWTDAAATVVCRYAAE